MKLFKLSLLVFPLFVLADNPILPADIDAVQESSTQEIVEEVAQEEPSKISDSDSDAKLTQSNYQQYISLALALKHLEIQADLG